MAGAPAHRHLQRALALVADHHLHPGRLADDAADGFAARADKFGDHAAHADAADLLVIREGEMQRLLQVRRSMSGTAARQHADKPFMSVEPRP